MSKLDMVKVMDCGCLIKLCDSKYKGAAEVNIFPCHDKCSTYAELVHQLNSRFQTIHRHHSGGAE